MLMKARYARPVPLPAAPPITLRMERSTRSGSATLELLRSGLTLVRFRPELKLSVDIIAEVMQARRDAKGNCAAIVVIPEHTDYDMDLLAVDHFTANSLVHHTDALAIVCQELGLTPFLRLYFAYHPPPFDFAFCTSLEEAKSWMRQRIGVGTVV